MATKSRPKPALGFQRLQMDDLAPAERNPRRGSVKDVVESLREFGQHRPVVVQQSTGQVIVGNHLFKAAEALGWDQIDAYVVDDDDERALRRGIADNAVGDKATWDETELADALEQVGAVPGYEEASVQRLLAKLADQAGVNDTPTFPIVARPNEEYDYVLVVAVTATDCAFLATKFQLRREQSYKQGSKPHIGRSHVVSVERLKELWGS
jgi:hypothetical protein